MNNNYNFPKKFIVVPPNSKFHRNPLSIVVSWMKHEEEWIDGQTRLHHDGCIKNAQSNITQHILYELYLVSSHICKKIDDTQTPL
jgi:hypothetical protein